MPINVALDILFFTYCTLLHTLVYLNHAHRLSYCSGTVSRNSASTTSDQFFTFNGETIQTSGIRKTPAFLMFVIRRGTKLAELSLILVINFLAFVYKCRITSEVPLRPEVLALTQSTYYYSRATSPSRLVSVQ